MAIKYKRILLKLSGESLMGEQQFGISPEMLSHYASQIKEFCIPVHMKLIQFLEVYFDFVLNCANYLNKVFFIS